MPLYEYECHSCGKRFEVLQKFSDEPLKVHEECGGAASRLLSAPAFHLKGTGWYATDYAKGGSSSSSTSSETKTEPAKADSKPSTESSQASNESKPAPASTETK